MMQRTPTQGIGRREFLTVSAGVASVPLFMPTQGLFAAPAPPDFVVVRGGEKLPLAEASYQRLKEGMKRYGGLVSHVKGKNVLIKLNATERSSQDGNTSPAAAEALLRLCKECGPATITVIGQEWGGFDSKRQGVPSLREVIAKAQVKLTELPHHWAKGSENSFKHQNPQGDVWNQLWVAKAIFEADTVLLNLARLKTHPHCVFTGCVKNVIGLTRRMYGFHKIDDLAPQKGDFAASDGWHVFPQKLGLAFRDVIGPRITLNILDAGQPTFGWRGPKPERIHTFDSHTTIIGTDALAMDVYGCGMLKKQRPDVYVEPLGDWSQGTSPYVQKNKTKMNYLVECGKLGVGKTDLSKANIDEAAIA